MTKANKNLFSALCSLFIVLPVFSQDQISANIPKIISPSPTVSSFMKFEEVPVNNYTGIPDISIPLFSGQTHSEDITIDISLRYHPSGIVIDEDASCTGLGWSLFAGGTISRTVRGIADEYEHTNHNYLGVHSDDSPYYEFANLIESGNGYQYPETIADFIWPAHEKNKYDSEHDLYQFNFMGHTGRFYLSKENNTYTVHSLDNNNAIAVEYNNPSNNILTSWFTLYDEKGYKYVFEAKELTKQTSVSSSSPQGNYGVIGGGGMSPAINLPEAVSAFHLTQIFDPKQNLLVTFNYTDLGVINEINTDVTTINNNLINPEYAHMVDGICTGASSALLPKTTLTSNTNASNTRKLKNIDIKDYAKIDFEYINDRTDSSVLNGWNTYRLKTIIVKNYYNKLIKEVRLVHDYLSLQLSSSTRKKRLSLINIDEIYGQKVRRYEMYYKEQPQDVQYVSKDYWGYVGNSLHNFPGFDAKDTNPYLTNIGVLQKMTLPSGESIIYDFEPNTYSYEGDEIKQDYYSNPINWSSEIKLSGNTQPGGKLMSKPDYPFSQLFKPTGSSGGVFKFKVLDQQGTIINSGAMCNDQQICGGLIEIPPYHQLMVTFSSLNQEGGNGSLSGILHTQKMDPVKYFYGGGIRIKSIAYFDNAGVMQDYYTTQYPELYKPVREKHYSYSMFDDAELSSGSLLFPKPVYKFSSVQNFAYRCFGGEVPFDLVQPQVGYETTTSFNNLKVLRTQGSDVGYKNVQVYETGNGYTRLTYTSPIDFPENVSLDAFFLPSSNKDYQRGNLTSENIYDKDFKILRETQHEYGYVRDSILTGHRILGMFNCPYIALDQINDAGVYYSRTQNCNTVNSQFCNVCEMPAEYIAYPPVIEYFGWTQLKSKITKEHFYNGSTEQGVVENKEDYAYNPLNKMISSAITTTYSGGQPETLTSLYTYYNNAASRNNIANLQKAVAYKNGSITATQNIIFNATTLKPSTIQVSKGAQPLENKVQFVSRDIYGNVQEVKREFGMSTVYIWGYNKTFPIAMIEGISYASATSLASSEISAAVTTSNSVDVTDAALLPKLNAIRSKLLAYNVTTYTSMPLIGTTSVTDPNGYLTTYEYDDHHRLTIVKDNEGKIISENKYNEPAEYDYE